VFETRRLKLLSLPCFVLDDVWKSNDSVEYINRKQMRFAGMKVNIRIKTALLLIEHRDVSRIG
jgi:hypothetical protein